MFSTVVSGRNFFCFCFLNWQKQATRSISVSSVASGWDPSRALNGLLADKSVDNILCVGLEPEPEHPEPAADRPWEIA